MIHTRITLIALFILSLSLLRASENITLPHQGRVLVSSTAYNGLGNFRFALINLADEIVWNHHGTTDTPTENIPLTVNRGFYAVNLGDTTIAGMAPLPADLFDVRNPLRLRIWFDDGVNGLEQIGADHPLRVSAYALSSNKSKGISEEASQVISQQESTISSLQAELDNALAKIEHTEERVQELENNQNQSGKPFDYSFLAALGYKSLQDTNLINAKLKGKDLSDANFTNADLSRADLSDSNLTNADLTNAILRDSNISNAIFDSAVMNNADLSGVLFKWVKFEDVAMPGANFSDAIFAKKEDFGNSNNFINVDLQKANFGSSEINRSLEFEESDLTDANFSSAKLDGVTFHNSDLTNADFSNADINQSDFGYGSIMSGTSFAGADLNNSFFETNPLDSDPMDLSGLNFDNAKLGNVKFDDRNGAGFILDNISCEDSIFDYDTQQSLLANAISLKSFNYDGFEIGPTLPSTTFPPEPNPLKFDFGGSKWGNAKFYKVDWSTNSSHYQLQSAEYNATKLSMLDGEFSKSDRFEYTDVDGNTVIEEGSFIFEVVDFNNTHFEDSNLSGLKMRGINLSNSIIEGTDFVDSEMGSVSGNVKLGQDSTTQLVKVETKFANSTLSDSNFTNATLEDADFTNAELTNVSFEGANLEKADFSNAKLEGVSFKNALLDGIDFTNAVLSDDTDLSGTNLTLDEIRSGN